MLARAGAPALRRAALAPAAALAAAWQPAVTSAARPHTRGFASGNDPIGVVGLGKMGSAMATNFINAGYPLVVNDCACGRVDACLLSTTVSALPPATPLHTVC